MKYRYVCTVCGYIYESDQEMPDDYLCPICSAGKSAFQRVVEEEKEQEQAEESIESYDDPLTEMSAIQMSALCSNLSKSCEKQYLHRESELFSKLSDYYEKRSAKPKEASEELLAKKISDNLKKEYPKANLVADDAHDRGAKRALTWSMKVTGMLDALLARYEKEKDAILSNTDIYVCEVCGFIYIGDELPSVCPVCKVPNFKMKKVERRTA